MAKRRISKASKRRLTFFGTLSLIAIFYFIFSLFYNAYVIYDLVQEKDKLEKNYVKLQEQAENLKIDIEKLNDPDYLANYARENGLSVFIILIFVIIVKKGNKRSSNNKKK